MNLKMADVIRAAAEERAAWDRMVNNIPRENLNRRTLNESRRDAANLALLNIITRVSEIAKEEA